MDKEIEKAISNMLKNYDLSQDEINYINYSDSSKTNEINHTRVISTYLLIKQLNQSTDKIIASNTVRAQADDRNSKKMQWLTWALVAVGLLQALGVIFTLFHI